VESCWFYSGGKFRNGKVKRIRFAHHGSGTREARELNVDPLTTRLVLGNMAKLIELQTIYSYPDMLELSEMLDLKEEAEYLRNKNASKSN